MKPLPLFILSGLIGLAPAYAETGTEKDQPPAKAESAIPAAAKFEVGSPAPAFKPAKWLKGEPVAAFDKDKTYLIECWATWCGPCVAAIPHVNALHEKFKDKGLVIIGTNVWEDTADEAEALVKSKGDGMAYRVAYDGGESGDIAKTWLKPAGVDGIPHAFVVRENKLLWQGHPGELTEETVADMIAGKFDAQKAAAEEKLNAEFEELANQFHELIEEKNTDEAANILARQVEIATRLSPEQGALIKKSGMIEIALAKGEIKSAVALIREFAEEGATVKDGGESQFQAAIWIISDPRLTGSRDYPLALTCIDRSIAAEPDEAQNPFVQLIRARALERTGKKDEAIKCLDGIIALIEDDDEKAELTTLLTALKAGKPWPQGDMNPDGKDEAAAEAK